MTTLKILAVVAFTIPFTLAGGAFAESPAPGGHGAAHGGAHGAAHGTAEAGATEDTAATAAFREINARMHSSMDIAYTNDVDIDFVRAMIPHHEAAVDMAKVALEHSSDPEVRALAEEVIAAQEAEIELMRGFLEKRGAAD